METQSQIILFILKKLRLPPFKKELSVSKDATVKFWKLWPLFGILLVNMFSLYIPCTFCVANLKRIYRIL